MSDSEEVGHIQLGKRSLEAIIEGVAAKLREDPPAKRANTAASSSGTGNGE